MKTVFFNPLDSTSFEVEPMESVIQIRHFLQLYFLIFMF